MNALLRVYSPISRLVCRARSARYKKGSGSQRISPIPVVSVGNLTLGGSEKTPLVIELLRLALELGRKPALITRGYRGSWEEKGGVLSDGCSVFASWREAGDEPAMIARRVPRAGIFIGKHRYLSCLEAQAGKFDLAVLDDAFQHFKLGRDLDIVLHDAATAQPLRESLSALGRADVLLWKGGGPAEKLTALRKRFPALPIFEYGIKPASLRLLDSDAEIPPGLLAGKRVCAVSGIARPERFAASLRELGAEPVASLAFPDHHPYPDRSLERIASEVAASGAEAAVTTEKDAVKLAGRLPADLTARVYVLGIELSLPPDLLARLRGVLGSLARTGARP